MERKIDECGNNSQVKTDGCVTYSHMGNNVARSYIEWRSRLQDILEFSKLLMKNDEYCYKENRFTPIYGTFLRNLSRWKMEMIFDKRSLHLACKRNDLKLVEQLILTDRKLCFRKDWSGKTPLHIAAENGRIEVIKLILKYCPESAKELTETTMETCLDLAIKHNKIEVALHLINWILEERLDLLYLLKFRSFGSELLQTSRALFRRRKLADVHALNSFGFMVPDNPRDLPCSENMDIEIDRIPQETRTMKARDLTKRKNTDDYSQRGYSSLNFSKQIIMPCCDYSHRASFNSSGDLTNQKIKHSDDSHRELSNRSSDVSTVKLNRSSDVSTVKLTIGLRDVLLLIASLFAVISFQVPFHVLGSTSEEGYIQDSIMSSWFICFNSLVFILSVNIIICILHEFPLKPWPHISILALFGSYMFSLKSISPIEATVLSFISIPILLVVICRKNFWLIVFALR